MVGVFLGFPLCQKHLGKSDTREGISAMIKHHLRQSQQRNGPHGRIGNHVAELLRETPCAKCKEGGEAENGEQTVKGALITLSSHKAYHGAHGSSRRSHPAMSSQLPVFPDDL